MRQQLNNQQRRAVSMIEVMIVVAVIVLLLALLVPSLRGAREQVRRAVCANNLRQWGVALNMYRQDWHDFLPTEGTYWEIAKSGTWFNVLPPYLGLPAYIDFDRNDDQIRELPNIHVWICPSKNLTKAFKSGSGKNQFHYGMNQVLDGIGTDEDATSTPGFLDGGEGPVHAVTFSQHPRTAFMFDIAPNSPAGTPRDVATDHWRDWRGKRLANFHGDYANFLFVSGVVDHFKTADIVTDGDLRHGEIIWDHPELYWGYSGPK